jgi:hypothetical protein
MAGGIALNEWLVRAGYLVLREPPQSPSRLETVKVDWARTTAWGSGGYYGRLFLNVRGREPQGLVPPEQYEATRDRLVAELEALGDPEGGPIGTRVLKPEALYRTVRGAAPPDLFVYFGDLRWRSVGTVGSGSIHTFENDTGPDDANHAPEGLLIATGPGIAARGPIAGMQLMDVTPTVLRLFGLDVPADLQGRVLDVALPRGLTPSGPPGGLRQHPEEDGRRDARQQGDGQALDQIHRGCARQLGAHQGHRRRRRHGPPRRRPQGGHRPDAGQRLCAGRASPAKTPKSTCVAAMPEPLANAKARVSSPATGSSSPGAAPARAPTCGPRPMARTPSPKQAAATMTEMTDWKA